MSLSVRDGGVWKPSKPWIRDEGVWKAVQKGWVREAGVWKPFYSAAQPIEFIGSATSTSSSGVAVPPEHQAGDLILCFANRPTSYLNTPPNWTELARIYAESGGFSFRYVTFGFKIAQSNSEPTVVFAGAARTSVAVFRNVAGIGNVATYNANSSTTTTPVSEVPITLPTSHVVVASSFNVMASPPAGMTKTPDNTFAYGGPYASFPATSFTTSSSQLHLSATIELLAE